jgi:pSer/pThr/pTyr-binding forkhead associated (FHA) protein
MMTKLYVLDGPDRGRSFDLEEDTITIGRAPDNHIQLKDSYVSRQHLKVLIRGEHYFIKDLKTKNGTSVDGISIRPGIECEIKEGSPIIIGVSVICLGEKCLEEIKAFLAAIKISRVSKEINEKETSILEVP